MIQLDELAMKAKDGDKVALETLARAVQDQIYNLAKRMLINPDDALDATQEILIILTTKLSTFKGDSQFRTWLYRVATNHLLNHKKSQAREQHLSFDMFKADLESGLVSDDKAADDVVMLNELRISCTMAMLLCLDLNHRMAYILGDILEFEQNEAAQIMEISKDNFRKRLSRARKEVQNFTANSCGIVSDKAPCRCPRRLPAAIEMGRIDINNPLYKNADVASYPDLLEQVSKLEKDLKTLSSQRATPNHKSPNDLAAEIVALF